MKTKCGVGLEGLTAVETEKVVMRINDVLDKMMQLGVVHNIESPLLLHLASVVLPVTVHHNFWMFVVSFNLFNLLGRFITIRDTFFG